MGQTVRHQDTETQRVATLPYPCMQEEAPNPMT